MSTATGRIPRYQDLKMLFKEVLGKDYPKEDYIKQFTLRAPENLAKIDRITKIYKTKVLHTPPIVFEVLEKQRERLRKVSKRYGNYISPDKFRK